MAVANQEVKITIKVVSKAAQEAIKKVNKHLRNINKVSLKARNAMMGVGFALLFIGMAIKNTSQRALSSLTKTFSKVMEGTTMYNQTIGRLSAAFEYLKFSIMDAFLTSEIGQALIEGLIQILDYFSSLPENVRVFIVVLLIAAVVLGAIMMVLGQIVLLILGIAAAASFLGAMLLPVLLTVILVSAVLLLIVAIIIAGKLGFKEVQGVLVAILMVVLLIGLALALAFGAGPILIGLIVAALVGLVAWVNIASKEFQLGFLKAVDKIAQAIQNQIIDRLNEMLSLFNRITGKNFKIPEMGTIGLSTMINKLQEEVDQERMSQGAQESVGEKFKNRMGNLVSGSLGEMLNIDTMSVILPGVGNADEFVSDITSGQLTNQSNGL